MKTWWNWRPEKGWRETRGRRSNRKTQQTQGAGNGKGGLFTWGGIISFWDIEPECRTVHEDRSSHSEPSSVPSCHHDKKKINIDILPRHHWIIFLASSTQWTWVWVNSGSWWWTGRPGVLRFTGWQRVGQDWATEMNWNRLESSKETESAPATSTVNETAACPPSPIAKDPSALPSPTSPSAVSNSSCLFTGC